MGKLIKILKSFNGCSECGQSIVEIVLEERVHRVRCGSDKCKKKQNPFVVAVSNMSYAEAKKNLKIAWNKCNPTSGSQIRFHERNIKKSEKEILRIKRLFGIDVVGIPTFEELRTEIRKYADRLEVCKRPDANMLRVDDVIERMRGFIGENSGTNG